VAIDGVVWHTLPMFDPQVNPNVSTQLVIFVGLFKAERMANFVFLGLLCRAPRKPGERPQSSSAYQTGAPAQRGEYLVYYG
jgi:hypothetical protein